MIYVVLAVLGLCFGSFINALVYRLHLQLKPHTSNLTRQTSIVKGRSMCVHCRHTLAWYDLLPVISWLGLGGKCRYCNKSISWQYPVVELLTTSLFVLSYVYFPSTFNLHTSYFLLALWLTTLTTLIALAVYDLKWMLLPDRLTYPLIGLSLALVMVESILLKDAGVLAGALGGFLAVGGLFYVLFQISDGKWIGGGDVKLGFAIGPLAGGFLEGMILVFIASLIGTAIALPSMVSKKGIRNKRIPFGPPLIAATIIVYLFGGRIIAMYQNWLLLG